MLPPPSRPRPPLKFRRTTSQDEVHVKPSSLERSRKSHLHRRNIFRDLELDFHALAQQYPFLEPHLRSNPHESPRGGEKDACAEEPDEEENARGVGFDFSSRPGVIQLTRALLHKYFGLVWDHHVDRLCPRVPNRLDYIHWIAELLEESEECVPRDHRLIRGVDIGCGASCIYPLLGCKTYGWSFLATEIDPTSVLYAKDNVERNDLENLIEVRQILTRDEAQREEQRRRARFLNISVSIGPTLPTQAEGSDHSKENAGGEKQVDSEEEEEEEEREFDTRNTSAYPILYEEGRDDAVFYPHETFHFCMCNPPFFESDLEYTTSSLNEDDQSLEDGDNDDDAEEEGEEDDCNARDSDVEQSDEESDPSSGEEDKDEKQTSSRPHPRPNPSTKGSTSTPSERLVAGGEVAFVKRMINDSFHLRERIIWYTSLIGKKKSVQPIRDYLAERGIANYRFSSLRQGRTARWLVAWSFTNAGLTAQEARVLAERREKIMATMNFRGTQKFDRTIHYDNVLFLWGIIHDYISAYPEIIEIVPLRDDGTLTNAKVTAKDTKGTHDFSVELFAFGRGEVSIVAQPILPTSHRDLHGGKPRPLDLAWSKWLDFCADFSLLLSSIEQVALASAPPLETTPNS